MITKEKFNQFFKFLQELIKGTEYETHVFFVGGAVRDFMMGRDIKNIDVVVDLPNGGEKFATWLAKKTDCYEKDINPCILLSGTRLYLTNKDEFKDISIRCSQTLKNAKYTVASKRIEDNLGTVLDDGQLRDLRINAMYLDVSEGVILDPSNGVDDLTNEILSTPYIPDIVFNDDPLRMVRVIRFAAQLHWGIEQKTWMSILKNHELIKKANIGLLREELNKILLSENPSYGLERLMASGMLYDLLPEFYGLNRVGRGCKIFNDNVWKHTLEVVDEVDNTLECRLSAFFHDIGKLSTFKVVNGAVHFYGHECAGLSTADKIMKRLGYPESITNKVKNVIRFHARFSSFGDTYTPTDKFIRRFISDTGDDLMLILEVMGSNFKSKRNSKIMLFLRIVEKIEETMSQMKTEKLVMPVNGQDIMEEFELKEGKVVGDILKKIEEELKVNPEMTKAEALLVAHDYLTKLV